MNKIYGVGYLGTEKNVRNNIKCYYVWRGMLRRCYDKQVWEKEPTYKNCSVCEEWHNYTNFKKWYEENYYEIPNENMQIDKDILFKGNLIYSPKTCCICPAKINSLFVKKKTKEYKNKNGLIEININRKTVKGKTYIYYCSRVCINNKRETHYFKTKEEAFKDYKNRKEQEIKRVADLYKNKIPKNLYDAMYNYQVEITD